MNFKRFIFFTLRNLQLEILKGKLRGRKPEDDVTPDLNVDIDLFDKCCQFIDIHLPLLTDFPPVNNELNETETKLSAVYFDCLTKALSILNGMIEWQNEDEMVGIELSTPDDSLDIFHDAVDPQWVSAKYYIILSFLI